MRKLQAIDPSDGSRKKVSPKKENGKEFYSGLTRQKYLEQMINTLIYGKYGNGKTKLSSTVSEVPRWITGDILFLSGEGGEGSTNTEGITFVHVQDYQTYADAYEYLKNQHLAWVHGDVDYAKKLYKDFFDIEGEVKNEDIPYFGVVIVDSLTEVQQYCKYNLIDLDLSDTNAMTDLPQKVRIQDWGTLKTMIFAMIRMYRDLPIHKIFIAQEEFRETADGRKEYMPSLQGSAKQHVHGFFDSVMRYTKSVNPSTDEINRELFLEPAGLFSAKNRFKRFNGISIENPNFIDVVKAKYGNNAEDFIVNLDKYFNEEGEVIDVE